MRTCIIFSEMQMGARLVVKWGGVSAMDWSEKNRRKFSELKIIRTRLFFSTKYKCEEKDNFLVSQILTHFLYSLA